MDGSEQARKMSWPRWDKKAAIGFGKLFDKHSCVSACGSAPLEPHGRIIMVLFDVRGPSNDRYFNHVLVFRPNGKLLHDFKNY